MGVDCLSFTGSTQIGKQLMQYAGHSNLKKVYLEFGGKSPNLVFADCKDLDKVARHAAEAIFHNQGEVCIAGSRLLVENSIREAFVEKVLAAAETMQPGDLLDPESFMGTMVDETHHRRVLDFIRQGVKEGASLRAGCTLARYSSTTGSVATRRCRSAASNNPAMVATSRIIVWRSISSSRRCGCHWPLELSRYVVS